jgi:hypothetical protein
MQNRMLLSKVAPSSKYLICPKPTSVAIICRADIKAECGNSVPTPPKRSESDFGNITEDDADAPIETNDNKAKRAKRDM